MPKCEQKLQEQVPEEPVLFQAISRSLWAPQGPAPLWGQIRTQAQGD